MSLFQQSKRLPLAEPCVKLYPHHALATGILQNNEYILPLLFSDYIQLVYDTVVQRMDFSVSLYIQSYIKHIPLTFQSLVPRELVGHGYKNVTDFLQSCIDKGYYIYCIVDTFYIGAYQNCYHTHHMVHDIMIYGYDKKKKEYDVADCFVDGKYQKAVVSEKELRDGLAIVQDEDWLDGFVLLKYNENPYRGVAYDVEWMKKEIEHYLNGESSGWIAVSEYRRRVPWDYVYGIEIYDALEEYLNQKEKNRESLDLRLPATFVAHKQVLKKIAEQLYETGKLLSLKEVKAAFSELENLAKNMELVMAKYNASGGSGSLTSVRELVRTMQGKDILAMNLFREHMKERTLVFQNGVTSCVEYLGEEKISGGDWREVYGTKGYHVIGANKELPDYLEEDGYVFYQAVCVLLTMNVKEGNALYRDRESKERVAAYYLSESSFFVQISMKDQKKHKISFYFLDYDHRNREQLVEILDAGSGQVLEKRMLSDFHQGICFCYLAEGELILKVTKISGPDAVISGIFWEE